METHGACQVIIVDWGSGQYAVVEASADDQNWAKEVCTERKKGRNLHCFSHDADDASGLVKWATQHSLTQTDVAHLMPSV